MSGVRSVTRAGMRAVAVVSPEYRLPVDVAQRVALQVDQLADLTLPMLDSIDNEATSSQE